MRLKSTCAHDVYLDIAVDTTCTIRKAALLSYLWGGERLVTPKILAKQPAHDRKLNHKERNKTSHLKKLALGRQRHCPHHSATTSTTFLCRYPCFCCELSDRQNVQAISIIHDPHLFMRMVPENFMLHPVMLLTCRAPNDMERIHNKKNRAEHKNPAVLNEPGEVEKRLERAM